MLALARSTEAQRRFQEEMPSTPRAKSLAREWKEVEFETDGR